MVEDVVGEARPTRRVLVTGHDGYIGSVLVPRLQAAGYQVTGLDTFFYEDCIFDGEPSRVPSLREDLRDVTADDLTGFDAIIHLAALSNDPLGELSRECTLSINYEASVRLARLAREAGVRRFLYASSCSLYGKSADGWVDECSSMAPLTAYAESKVSTEEDVRCLASPRFSPICLRFATVFGLSPKLRVDLVVNNLVGWGVTTGEVRILSDGTPWRPLIHVEDVAAAYEFFLRAPVDAVHNQTFNVGFNSHNYQVKTIADEVVNALPGVQATLAKQIDSDPRSYRVRFDRFESLSGLQPRWDLTAGIHDIVRAYQQVGLTNEEFTGYRFIRLNQIKRLIQGGRLGTDLRWVSQD